MLQAAKATHGGDLYACLNCLNPCIAYRNGQEIDCREIEDMPDVRMTTEPGTPKGHALTYLSNALDDLPVLPQVPQRVMAMVYDPMTSMRDVARVINDDPVIAVKILKLANSAYYGGRQSITSLDVACARLGMKMIVKMVHAVGSRNMYRTRSKELRDTMQRLWKHSVVAAYCAGEIASIMPILSSDEVFLAGLVHDIGRVVMLNVFSTMLERTGRKPAGSLDAFEPVVRSLHPLAGLHATQNWDLSTQFRVTTFFHHIPGSVPLDEWRPITHIVALANLMSKMLGYDAGADTCETYADHPSVSFLRLEPAAVEQMQEALRTQVDLIVQSLETE